MHQFDRDMSLAPLEPFRFKTAVTDNWSINGNPNGGYLMALTAGALMQCSDKKSTPIVTTNYISRCVPGDAEILVEEFSKSVQFNRLQARLVQDGKEKVRTMATFSAEKNECAIERYEASAPEIAPLEQCVQIPVMPKFTHFDNIDLRLDPACTGWLAGKLVDKSESKGWISFKDDRPYDLLSILMIADSFPPAIFASLGPASWVPTIELSTNVRKMPETKWLKGVLRTRFVTCGLLEADGEIWDGNGNLVAFSRQIAQLRKVGV